MKRYAVAQLTTVLGEKVNKDLQVVEAETVEEAVAIYTSTRPHINEHGLKVNAREFTEYENEQWEKEHTNETKEENTMKNATFTWNNAEYKQNEKGNRFYKVVDGKTTRIGQEEFFNAMDEYNKEDEEPKAEPKKARKPRRSKDIAHESTACKVTLTAKQVDFIKHIPDTCFYEDGLDSHVWVDCLCDDIGGQFAGKPMTVGAMVSTLREKGLVDVCRDDSRQGKPKVMCFTDLGKVVAQELGLR